MNGQIDLIKYLCTIVFLFNQTISMAQSPFDKALNALHFNINLETSAESVIKNLTQSNGLTRTSHSGDSFSLSSSMQMNTTETVLKKSYSFAMNKSPITGVKMDSGYIKIVVGETKNEKRILQKEWCIQFENQNGAREYFNMLNEIFLPLSIKNSLKE